MKNFINGLSIASRGLRAKLIIAFCLMSLIPLLVCLNYIFPSLIPLVILKANVGFMIGIAIFIAFLGFFTVKEMIDPVVEISSDAKKIAQGDFEHIIKLKRDDEIGDLGLSLNQLTRRIKDNMEELRNYSEQTKEINLEINKRVNVLSSLLQISNLISQNTELNEILEVSVGKSMQIGNSTLGMLILKEELSDDFVLKSVHGPKSVDITNRGITKLRIKRGEGFLGKLISTNKPFVLDSSKSVSREIEELQKTFMVTNVLIMPISILGVVFGLLVIGNEESNFKYPSADEEILSIFAKQISIALENDILMRRVEKLEVKDTLTGLFNESYITTRLDDEIKRAINFQRPCAFILLRINNFKDYHDAFGEIMAEAALKRIALVLRDSITDIDKAGRFSDYAFSLILPEKNKRQCIEFAESISKKIEFAFSEEADVKKRLTVTGAVTENPIDGIAAGELITKARAMLEKSESQGKSRILS